VNQYWLHFLEFRVYGIDGVRPPIPDRRGVFHEIFIFGECLARSPDRAMQVMRTTKQYLLHLGFEGRLSTAGNLAFHLGPAYRFNVYHLMEVDSIEKFFPAGVERI
jgi:hypothetical protein